MSQSFLRTPTSLFQVLLPVLLITPGIVTLPLQCKPLWYLKSNERQADPLSDTPAGQTIHDSLWQKNFGVLPNGRKGFKNDLLVIKETSDGQSFLPPFNKEFCVIFPKASCSKRLYDKYEAIRTAQPRVNPFAANNDKSDPLYTNYLDVEKMFATNVNPHQIGGAQFMANLGVAPRDSATLSYFVRFPANFDFVLGGKLPGLFGGSNHNDHANPNGNDGFSTRFMWRTNGNGEVYAYLPRNTIPGSMATTTNRGTSLGRGEWIFSADSKYHQIEQTVYLNTVKDKKLTQSLQDNANADGRIIVKYDGSKVLDKNGIVFRFVDGVKIDGLFFSAFFGGQEEEWAAGKDETLSLAGFSLLEAP